MSTALLTDRYELTMLEAALASGVAERRSVFEVFARSLPPGRRYGVVAGLGRFLDALGSFTFEDEQLAWLGARSVVSPRTLEWLAAFHFSGSIDAYEEGECYFPGSPVCTVSGPFGESLLLETLLLSVLNFDSAVASAAARMVLAAQGRPLIEMGSRRVHETAAVAAARAAYLAGFASTSNLEAGRRYGIPTAGTASHAFTLAYPSEGDAFAAQVATAGAGTTLLVDTFDTPDGIAAAVRAALHAGATGPGAVRLDSGDPVVEATRAREILDSLGATGTRIVVSSDLDEHALMRLRSAPVDAYGVGTSVATGAGAPTAGFVYKLVAIADAPGEHAPLRAVAKRSVDKVSTGGRKVAWRILDAAGVARAELLAVGEAEPDPLAVPAGGRPGPGAIAPPRDPLVEEAARSFGAEATARPLQIRVVEEGRVVRRSTLDEVRARVVAAISELDVPAREISPGPPALAAGIV